MFWQKMIARCTIPNQSRSRLLNGIAGSDTVAVMSTVFEMSTQNQNLNQVKLNVVPEIT